MRQQFFWLLWISPVVGYEAVYGLKPVAMDLKNMMCFYIS